jgi:hypothetical protein
MSADETGPPEETTSIEVLSAAVVSTATEAKGEWLFAGWSEADHPASAAEVSGLSENARRAFHAYRESGLWPRQVRYRRVEAAEYVLTGPAVDFGDHGTRRAQDQLQYIVLSEGGERKEVALGELAVLEAIVSAREPWQSVRETVGSEIARSAISLYTLFTPNPGSPPDTGLAVLFQPTIAMAGNEAAFRAFVRQSLGRLLVLDESQPPESRKGYLTAVAEHAGLPPQAGPVVLLVKLRDLGFVDFDDAWLRSLDRRLGRARAGFLRVLRALGAVDISNEDLREVANPRPTYDLDSLTIGKLVELAEAMYWEAREALK